MAQTCPDVSEMQLDGMAEGIDLLQIDVDTDVVEERAGRENAACSVSLFTQLNCP